MTHALFVAILAAGGAGLTTHALASDDRVNSDLPWPFGYHEYGFDVTRSGATPDRPYWHGDDAVPLGLRWRDQGWEGTPVEPRRRSRVPLQD